MPKRYLALLVVVLLLVVGCTAGGENVEPAAEPGDFVVTVFRSPSCSCCEDWIAYLEANGYTVLVEDVEDMATLKQRHRVPTQLYSCHTAVVDGYVVEGHVPVAEIGRMLAERPEISGIGVAAMPIGSPGMEVAGVADQPYDVMTFDAAGSMEIYASYGQ